MSSSNNKNNNSQTGKPNPRREAAMELEKFLDAVVRVKCLGGRELQGTLRGYDDLFNLVLDETQEFLRDPDTRIATSESRTLGISVIRGTQVSLIAPQDGVEEISNPFVSE